MSGIFTIMKKELRRFFTDTRMLVTVLLLPGLLIYVMYTVMGDAMGDMFMVEEDYVYRVGVAGDSVGKRLVPDWKSRYNGGKVRRCL